MEPHSVHDSHSRSLKAAAHATLVGWGAADAALLYNIETHRRHSCSGDSVMRQQEAPGIRPPRSWVNFLSNHRHRSHHLKSRCRQSSSRAE